MGLFEAVNAAKAAVDQNPPAPKSSGLSFVDNFRAQVAPKPAPAPQFSVNAPNAHPVTRTLGKRLVPIAGKAPTPSVGIKNIGALGGASTIAAQTAANTVPDVAATEQKVQSGHSTKLGIAVGLGTAVVGVGASLLAGLSATVAAPVGIGFGVGSGLVTKVLADRK